MLNIYICEDNLKQLEMLNKVINNFLLIEQYDAKLKLATSTPYEILDEIKNSNSTGIYFLDIDLKCDINGLKLAEKIRKYDPRGFIVFITTHAEMSYLTFVYKIEALDYIIKDDYNDIPSRIKLCIENSIERYSNINNRVKKVYSIKVDDKIINIDYNKILFFETSSNIHKVILNCIDRQIEFYSSLKEIQESLDDRFVRCHMSYIVNKENIKLIHRKNRKAVMINGQECYISIRGLKLL